jgi:hypothetical protein
MNDGKIEIEVFYEPRDFWQSAINHYFSLSSAYFLFFAFVVFGLFLTFLFLGGAADIEHFAVVALASWAAVLLFALTMSYLSFSRTKNFKWGKYVFTFSGEKVVIAAESFTSSMNWDWFVQIRETKNYFMLVSKVGQKSLLPKRFFGDSEQIAAFKNLASAKLGEKAYFKKSKEALGLK